MQHCGNNLGSMHFIWVLFCSYLRLTRTTGLVKKSWKATFYELINVPTFHGLLNILLVVLHGCWVKEEFLYGLLKSISFCCLLIWSCSQSSWFPLNVAPVSCLAVGVVKCQTILALLLLWCHPTTPECLFLFWYPHTEANNPWLTKDIFGLVY